MPAVKSSLGYSLYEKYREFGASIADGNHSAAAEMGDDEFRVADWV